MPGIELREVLPDVLQLRAMRLRKDCQNVKRAKRVVELRFGDFGSKKLDSRQSRQVGTGMTY